MGPMRERAKQRAPGSPAIRRIYPRNPHVPRPGWATWVTSLLYVATTMLKKGTTQVAGLVGSARPNSNQTSWFDSFVCVCVFFFFLCLCVSGNCWLSNQEVSFLYFCLWRPSFVNQISFRWLTLSVLWHSAHYVIHGCYQLNCFLLIRTCWRVLNHSQSYLNKIDDADEVQWTTASLEGTVLW